MEKLIQFLSPPPSPILTVKDFFDLKINKLISINNFDLHNYHKRDDSLGVDTFHKIYKSSGVYLIEFPNHVYVGSTGGDTMYFGRRWKTHSKLNQISLINLMVNTPPEQIIFHAIFETNSDSIGKFIEAGLIAYLSEHAPHLLVNCILSCQRKKYKKKI